MIRIVWDFEALNCGYKFATCTSFMMKDAKEGTADISTMQGLLAHLVKVVSSMMVWLGHKSRAQFKFRFCFWFWDTSQLCTWWTNSALSLCVGPSRGESAHKLACWNCRLSIIIVHSSYSIPVSKIQSAKSHFVIRTIRIGFEIFGWCRVEVGELLFE